MQLDPTDAWIFILSTIRYTLGRSSYAVQESQNLFFKYKKLLEPWQVKVIFEEVIGEIELTERMNKTLGDRINHDSWKEFVKNYSEGEQNEG